MIKSRRQTMVERREADDEGVIAMAGARASVESLGLMHRAVVGAEVSQGALARKMMVSEGRISQILNGNGNVRISTLARVLRAAGYRLQLDARPEDPDVRPLPQRRSRRGRPAQFRYISSMTRESIDLDSGVGSEDVTILSLSHPRSLAFECDWVHDLETGESGAPDRDGRKPRMLTGGYENESRARKVDA